MLRILFLGDIVGQPGREAVKAVLPMLRRRHRQDIVLANAENTAHGAGITRATIEELRAAGIDGFTAGDHTFDAKGVEAILEDDGVPLVRPGNWPGDVPGRGWRIIRKGKHRILLMNILGRIAMKVQADDPFDSIKRMLKEAAKHRYDASVLDIHAETTSEKRAIAEVFDGTIDLIVGTHTHVQTNDPKTLLKGTGFLTDLGMCGGTDSVLGVDKLIAIRKIRTNLPLRNEPAAGPCEVCGCIAEITKKRTTVTLVRVEG